MEIFVMPEGVSNTIAMLDQKERASEPKKAS
jgi:hypothetical protein